jgi:hypothetical protein
MLAISMAKKKEAQESSEGTPATAAKTTGAAAGTTTAPAGVIVKATPPRPKVPKLVKKNKSRLPRRQKKAAGKAAKSA